MKENENLIVRVAHRGKWSGADIYSISKDNVEYAGHLWGTSGNLVYTYREVVVKARMQRKKGEK